MRHNKSLERDFCYAGCALLPKPSTRALGISKYSIVTNNDSVTLRLMTEHDLAMLYEWLKSSPLSSSGGAEKKHARH